MKLRGIEFGCVFDASGSRNFFGDGWKCYEKYYKKIPGYTTNGTTLISKTVTYLPTAGNMPIDNNLQPLEFCPDCIRVNYVKCFVLNAVALTNPGLENLLARNVWQNMEKPFVISITATMRTLNDRLWEIKKITELLKEEKPKFKSPFGASLNVTCPNTGDDTMKLAREAIPQLEILAELEIPTITKLNLLTPIDVVKKIASSGLCDAIDIPNSYPFDALPKKFRKKLFRGGKSPLEKYGGGGYSGPYQTPLVADRISRFRVADIFLPIIAGSVYCARDVRTMKAAGANAIAIGAAKILRFWRLKGIEKEAIKEFGR
jgi:dihydroorotate dehydrogenase